MMIGPDLVCRHQQQQQQHLSSNWNEIYSEHDNHHLLLLQWLYVFYSDSSMNWKHWYGCVYDGPFIADSAWLNSNILLKYVVIIWKQ